MTTTGTMISTTIAMTSATLSSVSPTNIDAWTGSDAKAASAAATSAVPRRRSDDEVRIIQTPVTRTAAIVAQPRNGLRDCAYGAALPRKAAYQSTRTRVCANRAPFDDRKAVHDVA